MANGRRSAEYAELAIRIIGGFKVQTKGGPCAHGPAKRSGHLGGDVTCKEAAVQLAECGETNGNSRIQMPAPPQFNGGVDAEENRQAPAPGHQYPTSA